MSDILNPLGGRYIGPSGPVATTSVLGTVSDPPRGLRQVDPGTIIKGIVLGRESDGLTAIATDKGTVRVAANIPLPPGAQVTLEVRPAGDRLQVLILANETIARTTPQGAPVTPQPAGNNQAPPPPPSPSATSGPGTSGHEARPAPASGTQPPAPAPVRTDTPSIEFVGSSQRAVVVHASVPGTAPLPVPQAPPAPVPPGAAQPSPAPITAPAPAQAPSATQPLPAPAPTTATVPAQPPPAAGATTAPVTTPPIVTTMPGSQIQGSSLPGAAMPGAPVPIVTTAPGSVPTVATTQAALIAATFEKKDRNAAMPAAPLPLASPPPAEIPTGEAAAHYAVEPTDAHPAGSPLTTLVPQESALSAETRQRILALFAAAGTGRGMMPSEAPTVAPPQALAQALPIGAELKLRVLAVQMQANQQIEIDPIALDPQDAQGKIIFGRVVSITPAGHAVIHTPVGDIMLQNRSSLPVGAQLALAIDIVETAPPVTMPTPVVQSPQQALLSLSQGWPTLADLVALLQGAEAGPGRAAVDADTARQALNLLPHAGVKLGAGLMNAMAALRSGDLGKLLGPLLTAKGGSAEREEMVRRLRGEFSQLSALAQERPDVDWRALFLPVIDDQGRVTQVNLFYRRPKKNSEDGPGDRGSGTRFVVEADFSRLGPFQLDGLMRPQRFDLMIRSRARLNDRMRREIEAIYEEARGLTGFAGSIAFQTVNEFPVIPLEDLKRGTPTYTV
jgi:hypothetical protein